MLEAKTLTRPQTELSQHNICAHQYLVCVLLVALVGILYAQSTLFFSASRINVCTAHANYSVYTYVCAAGLSIWFGPYVCVYI